MQYVRKEDVFNQDMSVKTMVYQASTLFFFFIFIYLIYVIYISYIYIIHYHLSLFSFLFLKTTITKVRTLVLYFIGTYMYRRNLSTCSLSFILDLLALNYSLRLDKMRQKQCCYQKLNHIFCVKISNIMEQICFVLHILHNSKKSCNIVKYVPLLIN